MKKKLLIAAFILSSIICYSQTEPISGAWIWQDAKNTMSIFIKKGGNISEFYGLIDEVMLDKKIKKGQYVFENNSNLTITWQNQSVERNKVKFVDKDTIEISFYDEQNKFLKKTTFNRVIDEEVIIKR